MAKISQYILFFVMRGSDLAHRMRICFKLENNVIFCNFFSYSSFIIV